MNTKKFIMMKKIMMLMIMIKLKTNTTNNKRITSKYINKSMYFVNSFFSDANTFSVLLFSICFCLEFKLLYIIVIKIY